MATTMRRTNRTATPERWRAALGRAIAEGVEVRQVASTGQWVATSGRDAATAYALAVTGGVAHGCDCLAGLNGDPVCKHRAAYYLAAGMLDPEPPTPAAPAIRLVHRLCAPCDGKGYRVKQSALFGTTYRVDCRACGGTGLAGKEAPAPIAA